MDHTELKKVLHKLPKSLNESMKKEINTKMFINFPIFERYFSQKTLKQLIHKIEEKVYLTNEIVYNPGFIE